VSDELTPAGMEAAARPFAEPCARKLREWAESDHGTAMVNRLDLKRVMQEYDSLRSELAEAQATIARLTEERDQMRALIKQENGLMVINLVADLVKRRNIAAAAAAFVESCLCNGETDVPQLNAATGWAFASLVAAVEEGNKT
jgi:multidrug resistance efflux pump